MKFGEIIKEKRIELGMTQAELARQLGISKQFMGDLERGNRLISKITTLKNISEVLNLNKWDLLLQLAKERDNIELELIKHLCGIIKNEGD